VQQAWPNAFMPAFPDIFAANYLHAAGFVRTAETLMGPNEQQAFTSGPALADFRRRWKTQVYLSLRTKDAVQRYEVVAAKTRAAVADSSAVPSERPHAACGRRFWLEASAELVRLLETVWGDRWYIDVLFSKTLQLTMELLGRYQRTVCLLAKPEGAEGAAAGGWDAAASPPCWSAASLPARLSRTSADVLAVLSLLSGDSEAAAAEASPTLRQLVLDRLPAGVGGRPTEIVQTLLQEACAGLQPVLKELEATALQQVSAAAAAQFAAIRGIPAVYRMLNKPVPTKASPYVESALRPIQALRETAEQAAPGALAATWVRHAVDGVGQEFGAQAAQLLESTRQQEASLRRLAGRGSGGDGGSVIVAPDCGASFVPFSLTEEQEIHFFSDGQIP